MKKICFLLILLSIFHACKEDEKKAIQNSSDNNKVLAEWTEKIRLQKDSVQLKKQFVEVLDSLKLYDKAIEQIDSLIVKDKFNSNLWFRKAQLHENKGDTAEAIRSYEKSIEIYPSVESQLYLANLFAESKNVKAFPLCKNVSNMGLGRETVANCNFIAGIYFARTGNYNKALELFDKAINDNYTLMEAYMEKGFIFYELKNYTKAINIFEIAIKINNQYADAYYWKAKCNEAMKNNEEAILNYKRALGLDKQMKEAKMAIDRLERN